MQELKGGCYNNSQPELVNLNEERIFVEVHIVLNIMLKAFVLGESEYNKMHFCLETVIIVASNNCRKKLTYIFIHIIF